MVTEEHPFVRQEFEYEDYRFCINFMVSEIANGCAEDWAGSLKEKEEEAGLQKMWMSFKRMIVMMVTKEGSL